MRFVHQKTVDRLEKLADYLSENRMFLDTSTTRMGKWLEEYNKIKRSNPREFEYYCRLHNYDLTHDCDCTLYDRNDIRFGRRLDSKKLNVLRAMGFALYQDNFSWER